MKAIRKSDGAIIDVRLYDIDTSTGKFIFTDDSTNTHYNKAELDFNVEEVEEVTIDGWVARDRDGGIYVYWDEPITSFPSLTWESDPLEVTVIIKPKKKLSTE